MRALKTSLLVFALAFTAGVTLPALAEDPQACITDCKQQQKDCVKMCEEHAPKRIRHMCPKTCRQAADSCKKDCKKSPDGNGGGE